MGRGDPFLPFISHRFGDLTLSGAFKNRKYTGTTARHIKGDFTAYLNKSSNPNLPTKTALSLVRLPLSVCATAAKSPACFFNKLLFSNLFLCVCVCQSFLFLFSYLHPGSVGTKP